MRAVLPVVSFPCLSFTWELAVPGRYEAVDCGPGLLAAQNEPAAGFGGSGGAELWRMAEELLRGARHRGPDPTIGLLDERLVGLAGDELTFAEWFARWDAGSRAVIVDRLALYRAGLGPKSVCTPGRSTAKGASISLETLERHGLGLVVLPTALVITTTSERPGLEERNRLSAQVAEALLWGADRDDRFQSVARFRGESSPKAGALRPTKEWSG